MIEASFLCKGSTLRFEQIWSIRTGQCSVPLEPLHIVMMGRHRPLHLQNAKRLLASRSGLCHTT